MNMSYCKWQNTETDVAQCLADFDDMSDYEYNSWEEKRAAQKLFENVLEFLNGMGIIDGWDEEELNELLK
jgi:hypothetical protein